MSVIRPLNSKHACNPNVHFDSSRLNTAVWDTVSGRETLLCLGLLGVGGKSFHVLSSIQRVCFHFRMLNIYIKCFKKKLVFFFFCFFFIRFGLQTIEMFYFQQNKGRILDGVEGKGRLPHKLSKKTFAPPRKEKNRPFFATRKQIRSLCVFFLKGKQDQFDSIEVF